LQNARFDGALRQRGGVAGEVGLDLQGDFGAPVWHSVVGGQQIQVTADHGDALVEDLLFRTAQFTDRCVGGGVAGWFGYGAEGLVEQHVVEHLGLLGCNLLTVAMRVEGGPRVLSRQASITLQ